MIKEKKACFSILLLIVICMLFAACEDLTEKVSKDIQSSDQNVCLAAVDSIFENYDADHLELMDLLMDYLQTDGPYAPMIEEKLLTWASDPSNERSGLARSVLNAYIYGNMGDKAWQRIKDDPRLGPVMDELFASRSFRIENFIDNTDPLIIGRLLSFWLTDYDNTQSFSNESMDCFIGQSNLHDEYFDVWYSYFQTNGYSKIDILYPLLQNKLYDTPLQWYGNLAKNGFTDGQNLFNEKTMNNLDINKIAIIETSEQETGEPTTFISPLSFLIVPKENRLSLGNLYNAGTVINIYYKYVQARSYGIGDSIMAGGFRTDAEIVKIDYVNKKVLLTKTIKGSDLPDEATLVSGNNAIIGEPPSRETVVSEVLEILK